MGRRSPNLPGRSDARAVIFARGGDFEMQRDAPNPRSFPQGVEQDIWLVDSRG